MPVIEANDPRKFTLCPTPLSIQLNAKQNAASGGLLNALSKVSGIEIDNGIFKGLRTFVGISNSVKTTIGFDPFTGDGASEVLGTIGIGPGVLEKVNNIQPAIANGAIGQAKNIASKVRQGNFGLNDIPSTLQDFRNLKSTALKIFGNEQAASDVQCIGRASPFASDIATMFPKYKYLFVCQFTYSREYLNLVKGKEKEASFMIHKFNRPDFEFTYEDVNLYNFNTKVLTNMKFKPITFEMHDDNFNNAYNFAVNYVRAMSPITNIRTGNMFEFESMDFEKIHKFNASSESEDSLTNTASPYASGVNPLKGGHFNILENMQLYHIYDYGRKVNYYKFIRPRFDQIELSELDMAEGTTGSNIIYTMSYDNVFMDTNVSTAELSLADLTDVGIYPLPYNDAINRPPSEIPPTVSEFNANARTNAGNDLLNSLSEEDRAILGQNPGQPSNTDQDGNLIFPASQLNRAVPVPITRQAFEELTPDLQQQALAEAQRIDIVNQRE